MARNRLESMTSQAAFSLVWSRGSTTESGSGFCSEYEVSGPSWEFGLVLVGVTGFK